jgi:hypothetical protein
MTERDDRVTVVETGGGGGIIVGVLIAGLILIGVFFLFGDQLSGGPKNIDVDVNLPKLETPAKK